MRLLELCELEVDLASDLYLHFLEVAMLLGQGLFDFLQAALSSELELARTNSKGGDLLAQVLREALELFCRIFLARAQDFDLLSER